MIQQNLYSDVVSLNILATATKGIQDLNQLTKEYNQVIKPNAGRGIDKVIKQSIMMN